MCRHCYQGQRSRHIWTFVLNVIVSYFLSLPVVVLSLPYLSSSSTQTIVPVCKHVCFKIALLLRSLVISTDGYTAAHITCCEFSRDSQVHFWICMSVHNLSKTSVQDTLEDGQRFFLAEKMDGCRRADAPSHARPAHNGLLQKRLDKDFCWIICHVQLTGQSVRGLNWTRSEGWDGSDAAAAFFLSWASLKMVTGTQYYMYPKWECPFCVSRSLLQWHWLRKQAVCLTSNVTQCFMSHVCPYCREVQQCCKEVGKYLCNRCK